MMIFVFGSNEAGRHGAGAAKYALLHKGAIYGEGVGHFGESFALPTKDKNMETLPLNIIEAYVHGFISYALRHPELEFQVTCIGCGLAGLTHSEIAPMLTSAPDNCQFDELWRPFLGDDKKYWGTF